jgi:DNA-directed RNA polymerase beta subunit
MYTRNIKLPNGKVASFETSDDNEVGKQIIECFNKSLPAFPKNSNDIESKEFWQTVIENDIGNRNCTYILNNIYSNIITPIETNILKSRGYPTDIRNVIKYMCNEIVKGRIDDWNSTDNLRIRTSEIFVALLQKQIYAAYTEWVSKRLGGDQDAKLYINSTAVLSTIINSQSVQQFENINSQEELSMMTRITPIGIGGIPKAAAWPVQAMNTHYTYYGNIDPLETPNSASMGILQHLTIGSAITNTRGLFASRDRDKIKPHEILSVGPALIPFVESNDGARVTMASGQAKQAIPLKNKEMPAIQTGFESTLPALLSDFFIKRSPIEGEVTAVSDLEILIRDKNNKIHTIDIAPVLLKSGQGKNGLGVFQSIVKVGQKIKEKDIVAEGSGIKNGVMSTGLNMLVAFMPWKGYNFEDAMVISESAAKKFTSLHLEEQSVYLTEDDQVGYIATIGDYVKKGDVILTHSTTLYDTETLKHLRADGGKIVNIEIYSNLSEDLIPEIIKPAFEDFRERYTRLNGKYPIGSFKERGKPFIGILIKFSIQQELVLVKGDKLNNRHFNKGIVSIIEPDANMPMMPDGRRIEMIYSTLSVINRMNSGQLMEICTSMIAKKLHDIALTKSREEFILKYSAMLNLLDATDGQYYSKTSITKLKSMSDITYREMLKQIKETGFVPLVFPPFKTPPRENIIKALKLLGLSTTYKLKLPEYNKTTEPGVAVGYMYVNKLEHQSEKKLSSRSTGSYVTGTLAPTAGKKRGGGRKLGEGDLYSLLGWDMPILIDEMFGPLSSDHAAKHELISQIIQKGDSNFVVSQSNPTKDIFSQIMLAILLKAD